MPLSLIRRFWLGLALLLCVQLAHANASVVQENTNYTLSSVSSLASTFGSSTTVHNAIVAVVCTSASHTTSGVSASTSGALTSRASITGSGSQNICGLWELNNITGGAAETVTASFSGADNRSFIRIYEAGDVSTSAYLASHMATQASPGSGYDVVNSGNTSTLGSQPALIIGWMADEYAGGSGTPYQGTSPLTFTPITMDGTTGPNNQAWGDEYIRVTSTSAVAATFYIGTSAPVMSGVIALAEAGTGCTHTGYTSAGAIATPNGSSGSYVGKSGAFVTPNCSSVYYWSPAAGNFVEN